MMIMMTVWWLSLDSLSAQTLTSPRERSEVFVNIQYLYIIISTLSYPLTNRSTAVTFQAASTHRYMASSPVSTTPENLLGREHGNRQCFFTLLHARSTGTPCFMQHCELMNTCIFFAFIHHQLFLDSCCKHRMSQRKKSIVCLLLTLAISIVWPVEALLMSNKSEINSLLVAKSAWYC